MNFSILTPGRRHAVLAAVLLALLAAGCSSSSNRPKPAELADFKATLSPRTAWTVAVGAARGAPLKPAVLDNAVYAAAGDGSIVRVAPDNGQVAWRISAGTPLTSGVGSDGFVVAVGTPRGEVLAFGADGKPLWRAQVTSDVRSPPLVGRGLVIVRSTDHRVNAFEADSGKRRWTFSRATPPLTLRAPSAMAFAGDSVVVPPAMRSGPCRPSVKGAPGQMEAGPVVLPGAGVPEQPPVDSTTEMLSKHHQLSPAA